MEKHFNFTQAKIRNLPSPDSGRFDYVDTDVKKLVCRVSHTGNKSFLVTKRVDGRLKNVTIGKFPDFSVIEARKKAQEILSALNSGIDPTAEKRKQEAEKMTLSQALEKYLSNRDLKPRTIDDYRYKVHHDLEEWQTIPISKITEAMVIKKQKELTKRGKNLANAAMRVLRLVMNYAEAVGMIERSPVVILSKTRLWHKSKRRTRVIPNKQLKDWHVAVTELSNYKATVYLLTILYMGLRSNEAITLKWQHVNLNTKTLTVFDTKNGTDLTLPIPDPLIPYFKALKGITGEATWVFPSNDSSHPMWLPKKPIAAVTKASGVEFSSHDCRRTFATIAEAVNLPMSMIKRLMNHVTTDVTGGYIVTEEDTLREAINKIADYIQLRISKCE